MDHSLPQTVSFPIYNVFVAPEYTLYVVLSFSAAQYKYLYAATPFTCRVDFFILDRILPD